MCEKLKIILYLKGTGNNWTPVVGKWKWLASRAVTNSATRLEGRRGLLKVELGGRLLYWCKQCCSVNNLVLQTHTRFTRRAFSSEFLCKVDHGPIELSNHEDRSKTGVSSWIGFVAIRIGNLLWSAFRTPQDETPALARPLSSTLAFFRMFSIEQ